MTCRPADEIAPEWDKMVEESKKAGGDGSDEDVLTYAMFPNVAPKFFAERSKGPVDAASTFAKKEAPAAASKENKGGSYTSNVNGTSYNVTTGPAGDSMSVNVNGQAYNVTFGAAGSAPAAAAAPAAAVSGGQPVPSPVAGTLLRYAVSEGAQVKKGDTVIIIESMKMELEVKAPADGKISFVVQPGTQIAQGQTLANLGGAPVAAAPVASAQPAPAAAPAAPAPAAAAGGKPVAAPVAGTLLRYAVSEGASVSPDTTVIIIESMKMELEIKAGAAGKIHFIAATGSQIAQGATLAEVQ